MRWTTVVFLGIFLFAGLARAQAEGAPADAAYDSPRASVARFFELARAGDFRAAAAYLDVADRAHAPELARKLQMALDRRAFIEVDALSPEPNGDLEDGLPRNTEEIGRIEVPGRMAEPVRLLRRVRPEGATWVFSRQTCSHIDEWYAGIEGRRLFERLPEALRRPGPFDLLVWQWLALPTIVLVSLLVGGLLGRITRALLARMARHTKTDWDDRLLERLAGPIRLGWALVLFHFALPFLGLYRPAERTIGSLRDVVVVLVVVVALVRSVGVGVEVASRSAWARTNPASRSLVQIAARVGNFVAIAIASIMLLSSLGYDVGSLIAGLGIGGVIVALAAQKTVENLLGAFAIGIDQPLREGDFVSVDGRSGTVERVGLRSTRLRTVERTVVTIPNGRMADMTIETFAVRDRIRMACRIGVVYGTPAKTLRSLRDRLEAVVRAHPLTWQDEVVVRFVGLGESSLDFDVAFWFATAEYPRFLVAREEMLLSLLEAVETEGASIAFPTRTVVVARERDEGARDGQRAG